MATTNLKPRFADKQELQFIEAFICGCDRGNLRWRVDTLEKIAKGKKTFGDYEYLNRTVSSMIGELYEEMQDLGGWACVASLTIHAKMADGSLHCDSPGELLNELAKIAAAGAELSKSLDRLRELTEKD